MKHTLGPWRLIRRRNLDEYFEPRYCVVAGDDGNRIATISVRAVLDKDLLNARLIAAAPQLLEACIKLMAVCTGIPHGQSLDPVESKEVYQAMKLGRAAIAAAESHD